jgi:hypothetical protein
MSRPRSASAARATRPRRGSGSLPAALHELHRTLTDGIDGPPSVASEVLLASIALSSSSTSGASTSSTSTSTPSTSTPASTGRTAPLFARLLATGDPRVFREARAVGLGGLFRIGSQIDDFDTAELRAALRMCAAELQRLFGEAAATGAATQSAPFSPALLALGLAHEQTLAFAVADPPHASGAPPPQGAVAVAVASTGLTRRRRWGSHYTPWTLARTLVERALLHEALPAKPTVCDPAMGGGVFLLAAAVALSERLEVPLASIAPLLHGIDRDPRAVDVARFALHALAGSPDETVDEFGKRLVQGDALLDRVLDGRWSPPSSHSPIPPSTDVGFDLVIGNPPFVGGKRIATHLGRAYSAQLRAAFPGVSGNTDLCALFLRRSFENLRPTGAGGLVVTSAIAKGATRVGGLAAICRDGATLIEVDRALPWPGDAAVHISVLHFVKGPSSRPKRLDGRPVEHISAFLEEARSHEPPPRRRENEKLAFVGCYLRGMGFTFDDTNPEAMPLSLREDLLQRRPELARRLRPYLGGEEVARHPEQTAHRFALDLNDLTLADESRFPELFSLARRFVQPSRERLSTETAVNRGHRTRFFAWANARPELQRAVRQLPRMLVTPRISTQRFFAFLPTDVVPSEQLVVFALASYGAFAVLSSIVHEVWSRAFGSTQGVGLRYTPSDVFETFPLLERAQLFARLEEIGKTVYEERQRHLRARGIGLSELYAHLEEAPALAQLHRRLDEETLSAYGLPPNLANTIRRGPGSAQTEAGKRVVAHLRALTEA